MEDKLTKITAAIEAEKEKVYYLNSSENPGLELRLILGRVEALMALKREILIRGF